MAQVGNVQVAWRNRRRRLGDSVPGCLLFIAVVLGGSIWGYFQFIHWRPLVLAGHNHKTFVERKNWPAYLEYGRRFRVGFAFGIKAMCQQNYNLIKKFKKGEYKDDSGAFEADTKDFMNQLLESVQQFDGQEVPKRLEPAHIKVARCHGLCYESVLSLREANKAEGAERERLVKDAEKKAKDAWKMGDAGVKEFFRIWAASGT